MLSSEECLHYVSSYAVSKKLRQKFENSSCLGACVQPFDIRNWVEIFFRLMAG